jgi:hypothetical protein
MVTRRGLLPLAVSVLAAAALAACAASAVGAAGRGGPTGGPVDPEALIGHWDVAAPGEEPGAVLGLGDELVVERRCGRVSGGWRAAPEGLFVGHVTGGDSACFAAGRAPGAGWLGRVAAFRSDGVGQVLLDRAGQVVARLTPTGGPHPGSDVRTPAERRHLEARLRASLRRADPLPAGLVPALREQLVGRWEPLPSTGAAPGLVSREPPHVELRADGSWSGSDGCNGQYGRLASGPAGALVAVTGPQHLIGCANVDVGGRLAAAYRAGFDSGVLVLLDRAGRETARLRRV